MESNLKPVSAIPATEHQLPTNHFMNQQNIQTPASYQSTYHFSVHLNERQPPQQQPDSVSCLNTGYNAHLRDVDPAINLVGISNPETRWCTTAKTEGYESSSSEFAHSANIAAPTREMDQVQTLNMSYYCGDDTSRLIYYPSQGDYGCYSNQHYAEHRSNIWPTTNGEVLAHQYSTAFYDNQQQQQQQSQQENIQNKLSYYQQQQQDCQHEHYESRYHPYPSNDLYLSQSSTNHVSTDRTQMECGYYLNGSGNTSSYKPSAWASFESSTSTVDQANYSVSRKDDEQGSSESNDSSHQQHRVQQQEGQIQAQQRTRFRNLLGKSTQSKTNSNGVSTSAQRTNQCGVCGRNYARPSTLKTHLRTHTNERPFKCSVCLKTFSQAANLTAHQRVHTGERPFSCPICGRQFSQSSSVITHLRTHSGERPYRCSMCSRTFSDSSTLTKHCRIHSGEKPYQCDHCPLNFSQSGNLSRHLKLHQINSNGGNSTSNSNSSGISSSSSSGSIIQSTLYTGNDRSYPLPNDKNKSFIESQPKRSIKSQQR